MLGLVLVVDAVPVRLEDASFDVSAMLGVSTR